MNHTLFPALFLFTSLSITAHAACPAAPVGKPSDGVVQLVTSGTTGSTGFGPTSILDATRGGSVVFDVSASTLKFCDGTNWIAVASSIPSGSVMAFDLTTCPSGWTEYTAARGRFLRGIDNGAGNDPDGTRAPGNAQSDELKSHTHTGSVQARASSAVGLNSFAARANSSQGTSDPLGVIVDATGGNETRPKNVAVLFCRKT